MDLVQRLPVEIVRRIYLFGSAQIRAQKDKCLAVIRHRLPCYIESLSPLPHLVEYFFRMGQKQRAQVFRNVRRCCCCDRHLARRPAHYKDGRKFPFHDHFERDCACACRYVLRRLCKADLGFEYE